MATSSPTDENIQIEITENGTTTLATAGKYCDRNVDVNVNVPAKATQFTNLYDPANVVLKMTSNYSSSAGATFTSDNYCNYIVIPYKHEANEPIALRVRGISLPVRDRQGFTMYAEDGTTAVTWSQLSGVVEKSFDEYGDMILTFKSGSYVTKAWSYLHLNFQYTGYNTGPETALTGPIITINEPIGNGGYTG